MAVEVWRASRPCTRRPQRRQRPPWTWKAVTCGRTGGDFKNAGREWQRKHEPTPVRVHDFLDPALGKAIPYGVYDVGKNEGWVNVGVDHDTAEFAVESIRGWWRRMGRRAYPDATELLITADGGGSNSYRTRLWKVALQEFATTSGLRITVNHYPPGTSRSTSRPPSRLLAAGPPARRCLSAGKETPPRRIRRR